MQWIGLHWLSRWWQRRAIADSAAPVVPCVEVVVIEAAPMLEAGELSGLAANAVAVDAGLTYDRTVSTELQAPVPAAVEEVGSPAPVDQSILSANDLAAAALRNVIADDLPAADFAAVDALLTTSDAQRRVARAAAPLAQLPLSSRLLATASANRPKAKQSSQRPKASRGSVIAAGHYERPLKTAARPKQSPRRVVWQARPSRGVARAAVVTSRQATAMPLARAA